MKKKFLITGASSGIGRATALALDSAEHHLILCGRRRENLEATQKNIKNASTEIKIFDVKNKVEVFDTLKEIKSIDVLINNAGNAHGLATFDEMNVEDMEEMILGNVMGMIYVTKASLPVLLKSTNAHIINISSIAGKETYANGTVYCASKAAVEAISKGLRLDLVGKGIKVTNLAPGAVETEFSLVRFKGDNDKAKNVYNGYEPLVAEDIANAIVDILKYPAHVQIADITILPKAQASATTIFKEIKN